MKISNEYEFSTPPEDFARPLPLPGHITKVLARLVAGWRVPAFKSEGGGPFIWNDGDIESTTTAAYEEHGELVIETTFSDALLKSHLAHELRNRPCAGNLSNGLQFSAEMAHAAEVRVGDAVRFECVYWTVSAGSTRPKLWLAPLTVQQSTHPDCKNGIVVIDELNSGSSPIRRRIQDILYLNGQYNYYLLLPSDDAESAFLVIDTLSSAPPERSVLHREFLALQFVLGQRLYLSSLAGIDESENVVARVGGPYGLLRTKGFHQKLNPKYPVGDSIELNKLHASGKYAAALFKHVTTIERDHPEYGLRAAMTFYLISIGEILESAALSLHVGLEGLASKMFKVEADKAEHSATRGDAKKLYLTKRHSDWKAWCKQHASEILEMSRADVGDAILSALQRADSPGAAQKVETMLKHYEIPLTEEVKRVLTARNELVHEARLPQEDNVDRLVLHESVPRTLLVALIAKAVGYSGAILGYDNSCPAWWTATEAGDLWYLFTVELSENDRARSAEGPVPVTSVE